MTIPTLANPVLPSPKINTRRAAPTEASLSKFDAVLLLHNLPDEQLKSSLPLGAELATVATRKPGSQLSITMPGKQSTLLIALRLKEMTDTFQLETACRNAAKQAIGSGARSIAIVIHDDSIKQHTNVVQAAVATLCMADFALPKFTKKKRPSKSELKVTIFEPKKSPLKSVIAAARGNCLARWLSAAPPNLLDAVGYRNIAEKMARDHRWKYQFHSLAKLKRKGAGAFVAVAQGNENNDAGIVQLTRKASGKSARKKIALVGKGIIFDTGGTNLKPHNGMLNMHIDMGGSAVALGSLLALSEIDVPFDLEVWLAITENRTGPQAFKPQDVVTSLSGKTIQTIHTDAEGRMVLADTLTMAGRNKPDAILDFATLTGACVTAVTSQYSGVFSNRSALHPILKRAGVASGERVWPFPIGGDFLDNLKSETADIMQCPISGAGDHILAATFLEQFVPRGIPWVHMDLSACENNGGLGGVDTTITGFGVRYTTHLLLNHMTDIIKAGRRS
ncbi:MAG: leucyl aminopeptidase family protein [Woeseiaceae bacterium]